eukprot:13610855-Alexandrium_andersonii.AAC.1
MCIRDRASVTRNSRICAKSASCPRWECMYLPRAIAPLVPSATAEAEMSLRTPASPTNAAMASATSG